MSERHEEGGRLRGGAGGEEEEGEGEADRSGRQGRVFPLGIKPSLCREDSKGGLNSREKICIPSSIDVHPMGERVRNAYASDGLLLTSFWHGLQGSVAVATHALSHLLHHSKPPFQTPAICPSQTPQLPYLLLRPSPRHHPLILPVILACVLCPSSFFTLHHTN